MAATKAKTFSAVLERAGGRMNWTIIRVPFDVQKAWGTRGHIRVKGEILGPGGAAFAIRAALLPTGKGTHWMMVNTRMQAGAGVAPGMRARFRLQPDTAARVITLPRELERALNEDRRLRRWFDGLSSSMRRWYADQVNSSRNAETRRRRAGQFAEILYQAMEAEHGEPPPVLLQVFARNPEARIGWERMPPSHRRHHLMGICYYKSPAAKERRLQQAVAGMLKYAKKAREADN